MKKTVTAFEKITQLALVGIVILISGAFAIFITYGVWNGECDAFYLLWWAVPVLMIACFRHILLKE